MWHLPQSEHFCWQGSFDFLLLCGNWCKCIISLLFIHLNLHWLKHHFSRIFYRSKLHFRLNQTVNVNGLLLHAYIPRHEGSWTRQFTDRAQFSNLPLCTLRPGVNEECWHHSIKPGRGYMPYLPLQQKSCPKGGQRFAARSGWLRPSSSQATGLQRQPAMGSAGSRALLHQAPVLFKVPLV